MNVNETIVVDNVTLCWHNGLKTYTWCDDTKYIFDDYTNDNDAYYHKVTPGM